MKTINVILLALVFFYGCKAQKNIPKKEEYRIIDLGGNKDVVVANIINGAMISAYFGLDGFSEGTNFFDLSSQSTSLMDLEYQKNKNFLFYNDEKTMFIDCHCPMYYNYYIKNLKIEDGNYLLEFKKDIKIKGGDIKVSDKIQNILFENVDSNKYSHRYENLYFKDLDFMVIDIADTLNVKLTKEK